MQTEVNNSPMEPLLWISGGKRKDASGGSSDYGAEALELDTGMKHIYIYPEP